MYNYYLSMQNEVTFSTGLIMQVQALLKILFLLIIYLKCLVQYSVKVFISLVVLNTLTLAYFVKARCLLNFLNL